MARRIALLAALAPLVLPAVAGAATPARFFAGTPVDGPSADIQSLGDLDVARDGTGALAYVKRVAGIDHVFVSRLVNGSFQAPEQVDAGLAGAGSQPVVAASDGGRLVVAFVSGGGIFTTVRPAGAPGYAAIQQIADAGPEPRRRDVDQRRGLPRPGPPPATCRPPAWSATATTFNGVPGPLDIDPAATAGTGTGRPKVAVAADGVATVVWGEGGHAYARRIFELRLSTAPQDLGRGRRRARHLQRGRLELRVGRLPPGRPGHRTAARRLAVRPAGAHRGRARAPTRRASRSTGAASATRAWAARRRSAPTAPSSRTTCSTRAC